MSRSSSGARCRPSSTPAATPRPRQSLHKSQSALTYAVQKLESQLGVKAFTIEGRKAVLTPTGQFLYRRARALLDDAGSAEQAARALSAGWEAEIRLAVEILFPTWLLLRCLDRFGAESPHTRIEVVESVLGGTGEALLQGQADLAISPRVPPGFLGDPLMRFRAIPVAHPAHPLHQLQPQADAPRSARPPAPCRARIRQSPRHASAVRGSGPAVDRQQHVDIDPGGEHGLRLRLVPGRQDP